MNKKSFLLVLLAMLPIISSAQQVKTSSSTMKGNTWGNPVPFNVSSTGTEYSFATGMGGWSDAQFALKQRNYVGTDNLGVARIGFTGRNSTSSTLPNSLSNDQQTALNNELNNIAETGVKNIYLLCGISGTVSTNDWNSTTTTNRQRRNYYVNEMALAVQYIENKGYTVVAVSPFNEPDYNAEKNCGNATTFNTIAGLMQNNNTLKGKVYGPSTLNSTQASTWYNTVKGNINFANTHQLAGETFAQYKGFWQTAKNDGKRLIADEMHNVMEAMACMHYGGTGGTWWGYDGVTRAEFQRTNVSGNGKELAYKEDEANWAVAGVYQYKANGRTQAVLGTSERNALSSAFELLSRGRLAYFDGQGPFYDFTQKMPGGTAYWSGQTNAERIIGIQTGEDVPVEYISGNYKIVNKNSGKVLSVAAGNLFDAANVNQFTDGNIDNQTWKVTPVLPSVGGDFSYYYITNANTSSNTFHLDDNNWGLDPGANVIIYPGGGSGCEQWHLRYVGDGYFTIVNRHSGLVLEVDGANTQDGGNVRLWTNTEHPCQLWKFVPANAAVDAVAPLQPTGLTATPQSGGVLLSWTASGEKDLCGYMIYRYNTAAEIWECIGRKVKGASFLDNTCRKGQTIRYRIKAIDNSFNLSPASEEVSSQTTTANALVGQWNFSGTMADATINKLDAIRVGGDAYLTSGIHAGVNLSGTKDYVKLPYHVGDTPSMTFAAWVYSNSATPWQRIFDFGNGEDSYLFLTPTNGSNMRFEIKANGTNQGLNATALGTDSWKHVAVTIGSSGVKIYINGTQNATSTSITLRPSDVAPSLCYLGRSQFEADPAFKGSIGDVRIYNYELSASEVAELANTMTSPSASTSPYEITSERISSLHTNASNWTSLLGNYFTCSDSYTRIYNSENKIDGENVALKALKYLPEGDYRLTAEVATSRNATNVWIYAQNQLTAVQTSGTTSYTTYTAEASVTENDEYSFNLGLRQVFDQWNTGATDVRARNFKLYYIGTKVEYEAALRRMLQGFIDNASQLVDEPMNSNVRNMLQLAISTANTQMAHYEDGTLTTTYSSIVSTIQTLESSMETAQLSIDAYKPMGTELAHSITKATAYPQSAVGALNSYNDAYATLETNYYNGAYTDSEIISVGVPAVRRITNAYLMSDAEVNARETNPIDVTALVLESAKFDNDVYAPYWTTSPNPGMGYSSAEFFNTNFNLYQILYGMPAGTYRFETRGFYRYGGQDTNYNAYNNGTLQRNAKIYIIDADGGKGTVTADVMAISDDPSPVHQWGAWSSQTYNGNPVPDNMQAASEAIDVRERYVPKDGMNTVTLSYSEGGDLTVGVRKDVKVGADWSFFGDFSLYYLGNLITLDEMAAELPLVRSASVNVQLARTIKDGEWNTLCLPFSLSPAQVKDVFGDNVVLKMLESTERTGDKVDMYFDEVTNIMANTPYIIKNATVSDNFFISGVNYNPQANPSTVTDDVVFQGVYAYPTVLNNTGGTDYYLKENTLYQSPGGTKMKGFRAFFKVTNPEVKTLGWNGADDLPTGIEIITKDQVQGPVYDLSGRRVSHPSRGLYIVGGKKVLLK